MIRIRITTRFDAYPDGVTLTSYAPGDVVEVEASFAEMLEAKGLADLDGVAEAPAPVDPAPTDEPSAEPIGEH